MTARHSGETRIAEQPEGITRLYRVNWENGAGERCEMAVHADSAEEAAWRAALKLQGRTEMQIFISVSEITAAERGES